MNQNPTNTQIVQDRVQHSKPIPISTHHLRSHSPSFSESSNSPASPTLVTPNFPTTRIQSSSSSPILYFLSQSPSKGPSTFPFRGFPHPPVLEDETSEEPSPSAHARRASTNTVGRFQPQPAVPDSHHERGVNVLRRLSLGGHLGKPTVADIPQPGIPSPPPNSAVTSPPITSNIVPNRKSRRSATVSGQTRPRRAPSPMGERILKGHFDGFI